MIAQKLRPLYLRSNVPSQGLTGLHWKDLPGNSYTTFHVVSLQAVLRLVVISQELKTLYLKSVSRWLYIGFDTG
jgi:hypothetical protein